MESSNPEAQKRAANESQSLSDLASMLAWAIVGIPMLALLIFAIKFWVAMTGPNGVDFWSQILIVLVYVVVFFIGGPFWGLAFLASPIYLGPPIERLLEELRGGPPWYRFQSDTDCYPEHWKQGAFEIHNHIADALNPEMDRLGELRLSTPKLLSEPAFRLVPSEKRSKEGDYVPEKLRIAFPRYVVPLHFFYGLIEANNLTGRQASGFLVGPENTSVEAAEQLFNSAPSTAIRQYSGTWLTRNPYALFKATNGVEMVVDNLKGVSTRIAQTMSEIRGVDPVGPAKEFSPAEFDDVLWRLHFFNALVAGTGLQFEGKPPAPSWMSDQIPFELPVPALALPERLAVLKLVPGASASLSSASRFWDALRNLKRGFAFDLMAERSGIYIRLSFPKEEQSFVESQLQIHFPDFVILPEDSLVEDCKPRYAAEVSTKSPHCQLSSFRQGSPDSYASLLQLLDTVPVEDSFCFRVLSFPLCNDAIQAAARELERLGTKSALLALQRQWGWEPEYMRGEHLTDKAENLRRNLKRWADGLVGKLPGWIASINVYTNSKRLLSEIERRWLSQYATPEQKFELCPAKEVTRLATGLGKWTVWTNEELAAVAHFPDSEVECIRLERTTGKMKAPPALMTGQGSVIGINEFRGQKNSIAIPDSVRDRHLYIIGKTRTGKSTLMLNLAVQDIRAGKGIGVIDPHGDLIEDLLRYIPKERIEDTVHWDASERTRPIGLNIMEVHTDEEVGLVADDLLVTFRRLSDSWGERMESLLRYVFHTLLNCEGTTFFDVQNILVSEKRRQELFSQLEDPTLIQFWREQVKLYGKDAIQPILSRMSKFVLTPSVSAALGQRNSGLNFFEVLQNQKILLVNLASGKIGEDSAKLLGSLVVSQIQLAAMRRAKVRREARAPFYLYVDEFQNFTTSSFDKILSEAGKYKLCLALAHQYISQLDDKIRNAILGNAGTLMMFPSSAQDAQCLRAELGTYTVEDLTDLSAQDHEALCRPPTKSSDTFKLRTLPPPERPAENHAHEVIEHSRATYGRPLETPSVHPREPKAKPTPVATSSVTPEQPPAARVPAPLGPAPRPTLQPPPVTGQKPAATTEAHKVKDVPLVLGPTSQGRGGMAHKQLQYLIRNFGQKFGYETTIEKQILGGAGSVDIALQKGDLSIACQVCVTTGAEYEVQSIRKCLEAGFSAIVLISDSRKTLNKARDLLTSAVPPVAENRVRFLALEDLAAFLAELEAAGASKVETIRGRKVSVTYTALSPEEQEMRKQAIHEVVAASLLRLGRMQPD